MSCRREKLMKNFKWCQMINWRSLPRHWRTVSFYFRSIDEMKAVAFRGGKMGNCIDFIRSIRWHIYKPSPFRSNSRKNRRRFLYFVPKNGIKTVEKPHVIILSASHILGSNVKLTRKSTMFSCAVFFSLARRGYFHQMSIEFGRPNIIATRCNMRYRNKNRISRWSDRQNEERKTVQSHI